MLAHPRRRGVPGARVPVSRPASLDASVGALRGTPVRRLSRRRAQRARPAWPTWRGSSGRGSRSSTLRTLSRCVWRTSSPYRPRTGRRSGSGRSPPAWWSSAPGPSTRSGPPPTMRRSIVRARAGREASTIRVWREGLSVSHAAMGDLERRAFPLLKRGEPFARLCAAGRATSSRGGGARGGQPPACAGSRTASSRVFPRSAPPLGPAGASSRPRPCQAQEAPEVVPRRSHALRRVRPTPDHADRRCRAARSGRHRAGPAGPPARRACSTGSSDARAWWRGTTVASPRGTRGSSWCRERAAA